MEGEGGRGGEGVGAKLQRAQGTRINRLVNRITERINSVNILATFFKGKFILRPNVL